MILTEEEAKQIIEKIISFSKSDSVVVNLSGGNSTNLRFALNSVSTCGAEDSIHISITSNTEKKSGSVFVTSLKTSDLENAVKKSEEIAAVSPENDEFTPPPAKQNGYIKVKEFFEDTDKLNAEIISDKISYTLNKANEKELTSAGYFEKKSEFTAIGNSNGLFAYHKGTNSKFSVTMRTSESNGSGKVNKSYADINLLNIKKYSDEVADKALLSINPVRHEPRKYVTILDNSAVADLINNLMHYFSRRSADEGRSFFSDNKNHNKTGQRITGDNVTIYSDPDMKEAPAMPFSVQGIPVHRTEWIENGILKNLYSSIYWAQKTNSEYVPYPVNVIMKGTNKSVEDLIASTENGIFVSRFWYIRAVDPKQILLTGLTRDGVFLIENGKLKKPLYNFRFNESPVNVLNKIIDMSTAEKSVGSESGDSRIIVPALKLSEFNFSTVSEAV